MNLILTQRCNKNCSFCFAYKKNSNNEMSVDFVERLIDQYKDNHSYTLLGGEPTINPDFIEIVKLISNRKKKCSLMTNFLFSETLCDELYKVWDVNYHKVMLINIMELNIGTRITTFKRNYDKFIEKVHSMVFSFTITENHTIEYFENYCDFLIRHGINNLKFIRFGLDLSGTYIINNTIIGDIVKIVSDKMLDQNGVCGFDCMVPPCVFNYDISTSLKQANIACFKSFCPYSPLDTFADGSVRYCYPTKNIATIENVFDYDSIQLLTSALMIQLNEHRSKVKIDERCLTCAKYKIECNSLCNGCYRNLI